MLNVNRVHSLARSSVPSAPSAPSAPSVPSVPSVPPGRIGPRRAVERHELHCVVDGDWRQAEPSRTELRGSLAVGLAAMAMLPMVELLLGAWPGASRGVVAAIASLPLLALVLVAITWRSGGGR